jgi:hypothetical protein
VAARVPSTDLYAELGVGADASPEEITAAFRARARELHPDTNPEPTAGERFKRITAAYDVLSDPADRARYDAGRRPPQPLGAPRPAATVPRAPSAAASARVDGRPAPSPEPLILGWRMTRRRARWLCVCGIVCVLLAAAVTVWVLADPDTGAADQTARNITLWIVAAKLYVGGVLGILVGARRLRNRLP